MLDTNAFNQATQDAAIVKQQVTLAWPTICAVSIIVARELSRFNAWAMKVAEFGIRHGGFGLLLKKLIWNPAAVSAPPVTSTTTQPQPTVKE